MKRLAYLLLLAACAQPPLRVASDLDHVPFAWVDENGERGGYEVEMIERLAEHLDREVEWHRRPFSELLELVATGQVDLACATLGITEEREGQVNFSRPYLRTGIAVVVRSGAGEPQSVEDLVGLRVFGAAGTTSAEAIHSSLPSSIALTSESKDSDAAERLLSGDIDAAVMDASPAGRMAAAYPNTLRVLGELSSEHYGIAIDPNQPNLLEAIDAWLAGQEDPLGIER